MQRAGSGAIEAEIREKAYRLHAKAQGAGRVDGWQERTHASFQQTVAGFCVEMSCATPQPQTVAKFKNCAPKNSPDQNGFPVAEIRRAQIFKFLVVNNG